MRTIHILLVLTLYALFSSSCNQTHSETSHSQVTDSVHLLTDDQRAKLTDKVLELQNSVGSQIAIVIVGTLHGEKLEDYSFRIANAWRIGRKDFDDGILITVALDEKKVRIEVGAGLEKIVKDETAGRIIRDDMLPNFKDGKYYEGLDAAVASLTALIKDNKELVGQH